MVMAEGTAVLRRNRPGTKAKTATEQWIFLCAAHKTPKECPAIDYTRHTLDGAACLLNSNKYFPSRVSIKDSSVAKLGSVCRRIYRIFSHAYFHHRQIFDKYEVSKI
ncbi:MOB-like protein phocein, partial [Sinocyclocheilus grahami]|uniref:MOB-like protein phocein n=1 Tax=Sinocyclocheilus grahami TaxID=75366 RepID=UPI0007AD0285